MRGLMKRGLVSKGRSDTKSRHVQYALDRHALDALLDDLYDETH